LVPRALLWNQAQSRSSASAPAAGDFRAGECAQPARTRNVPLPDSVLNRAYLGMPQWKAHLLNSGGAHELPGVPQVTWQSVSGCFAAACSIQSDVRYEISARARGADQTARQAA